MNQKLFQSFRLENYDSGVYMLDTPSDAQTRTQDIQRDLTMLRDDLARLRESGVKAASSKLQERPLGAVLIAFAVGFLGGRLL